MAQFALANRAWGQQAVPAITNETLSREAATTALSRADCVLILAASFLGWLFAGCQLAASTLVMREATVDFLGPIDEKVIGGWSGWLTASFLLGAAAGGYFFGWIGDRFGRKQGLAAAIACYSIFAGLAALSQNPTQLLVIRFITGMGVGGVWPNGVSLIAEAWPNASRPLLAGIMGTAANVGLMFFSLLIIYVHVTPDHWRWIMYLGFLPLLLAVFVWGLVPESPKWLALQVASSARIDPSTNRSAPTVGVFRPPLLKVTCVGILLGAIPLFGSWSASTWANQWASQVGGTKSASRSGTDPGLKGRGMLAKTGTGAVTSLLGGALAMLLGRRRCYFLLSAASLCAAQFLFWFTTPGEPRFIYAQGALGFSLGFYFGWLPLCLPELFPTSVRSTGAGVSFNMGRILTALGILAGAWFLKEVFHGDYAQIGRWTTAVFLLGLIVIWLAPDMSQKGIDD